MLHEILLQLFLIKLPLIQTEVLERRRLRFLESVVMAARSAFLNYASGQSYGALCDALANADGVINVAADLARQRSRWGPLTPKMGLKVPAAVPLPAAPAAGATTLSSHVFESEIDHDVVSENTTRHEPFSFDTTIDADLSNEARVFLSTTENVARFQRNATPRQIATAGVVEMETNGVGNVVHLGTPLADVSAAATEDSIEALQGSGAKSIIDVSNLSVDEARDAKVERDDDHANCNADCINNNINDVFHLPLPGGGQSIFGQRCSRQNANFILQH